MITKRVFIINGKVCGAISRVPKKGSFLSNMSKGAKPININLTKLENKISKSWNKSGIISFLNLIKSNIFNYNFDSKINYQIYKYSLLDKLTNPDEEFKQVIINHFILKKK